MKLIVGNVSENVTERNILTLIKKRVRDVFHKRINVEHIAAGLFQIDGNENDLRILHMWFKGRRWHKRVFKAYLIGEGSNIEALGDYKGRMLRFIALERDEEIRSITEEIKRLSGKAREVKGRALLDMRGSYKGEVLGGFEYMFRKEDGSSLPETQFKPGDVITVATGNPLDKQAASGTLRYSGRHAVYVIFQKRLRSPYLHHARMDLFYNESTYERMENAVYGMLENDMISMTIENRYTPKPVLEEKVDSEKLNDTQRAAVERSLGCGDFHLIHGPPGTGKTLTLSYLIKELVGRGKRILVSADSNTAVDVLSTRLIALNIDMVRVGVSVKIDEEMMAHTLDRRVKEHGEYGIIEELEKRIGEIKMKLNEVRRPQQSIRRGLQAEDIVRAIKKKHSIRGIPLPELLKMGEWAELTAELQRSAGEIIRLKERITDEIIDGASVIASTNSNCGTQIMQGRRFDYVVHDEATQATEPSSLIPIAMGKYFILAGDHHQLPPTVLSDRAAREGFRNSLFQRLIGAYPVNSIMLDTQYRMNEELAFLTSESFYSGRLVTAQEVRDNFLDNETSKIIAPDCDSAFCFIDMDGVEERYRDTMSYMNREEAEKVKEITDKLFNSGFKGSLGIITGYNGQKNLLKELIDTSERDIDINTVDGFQGNEKDVIIFSLTRSNGKNDTGFLKDRRRMNVALSRAGKKLIVVGNGKIFAKLCDEIGIKIKE